MDKANLRNIMLSSFFKRIVIAVQFRFVLGFQNIEITANFSVLKLIKIAILSVYDTIPFDFSLFRIFGTFLFNFWNYFFWLRITDEGSVPEMRIWSMLLIKSDSKYWKHLSWSLFLYCIQILTLYSRELLEQFKPFFVKEHSV